MPNAYKKVLMLDGRGLLLVFGHESDFIYYVFLLAIFLLKEYSQRDQDHTSHELYIRIVKVMSMIDFPQCQYDCVKQLTCTEGQDQSRFSGR